MQLFLKHLRGILGQVLGRGQEESRFHPPAPELTAEGRGWPHRRLLMRKVTVQCRRLREPGGEPWPSQGKGV